jgi:hypothetical protein
VAFFAVLAISLFPVIAKIGKIPLEAVNFVPYDAWLAQILFDFRPYFAKGVPKFVRERIPFTFHF